MLRDRYLVILACLAVGACDNGRLSLSVADAPIDSATQVVVQFNAVVAERSDGGSERFELTPPAVVDLAALRGGLAQRLLDQRQIPSGDYRAIRLEVQAGADADDSFIALDDGSRHALMLAAADEAGLRVQNSFSFDRGDAIHFIVDIDLRKSIHPPAEAGDPFQLRPSMRLVRDDNVGAIAGTIDPALIVEGCSAAVYAYRGSDITPDDAGSPTAPFASALPTDNFATGIPEYRIAFLPPGDYGVAFTCEAVDDDPGADDEIAFMSAQDVPVESGRDARANFQ